MNLQVDGDIPEQVQYSDNTGLGDWMLTEDKTKKWTHTKTKAINVAVTHNGAMPSRSCGKPGLV